LKLSVPTVTASLKHLAKLGIARETTGRNEELPYRAEQLLGSKKLSETGKLAKPLGRANAAQAICREVLSRVSLSNLEK